MPDNPAFALQPRQAVPSSVTAALAAKPVEKAAPLTDTDFEHLFNKSMESSESRQKVHEFISGDDVSEDERNAFYSWINEGPGKTRREEIAANPAKAEMERPDRSVFSLGGIGIEPEMLMGLGALGRGAVNLGKAVVTGNLPAVGAELAPFAKFEAVRWLLQKAGIPAPTEVAFLLSGGRWGRRGGLGGRGSAPKEPSTLDEQLGVSKTSTGATMAELPPTPPPARERAAIMPDPAAARTAERAAGREELGLPSTSQVPSVAGEDDLASLRQELMRRGSSIVPPARSVVEPPMRRTGAPEPSPQGTINDLPVFRQQAMMEQSMGSRMTPAPERPHRYAEPPSRPYEPSPALSPRTQVDIDAGLDDAAILRKIVQLRPNELAKYLQESPRAAALLEGGRVPSPGAFKPSALRSELTEPSINPKVMEQQFEQANPAFRAMEESGAFGGERTTGAIAPAAGVSTAGSAEPIQGTRRMSAENERLASELAEKFKGKFTVEEIRTMLAYRNTAGLPKFGSRLNLFEEVLRRMTEKE